MLANHGTLKAGLGAAVNSWADNTTIINDGTILSVAPIFEPAIHLLDRGEGDSEELEEREFDNTATIINTGTIRSEHWHAILAGDMSQVSLVNEGTISGTLGSIWLSYVGADTVTNDGYLDGLARLGGGNDIYHGENGRITGAVWGQGGNDMLEGGAFADVLSGGTGSDTVTGGGGADTLTGAAGADVVSGGAGDDVFRFGAAGDATGDAIVASGGALAFAGAGTAGGDRIDVSAIDADLATAGHQSFAFGTSHDVGHLWAVDVGGVTHIRGNVAEGAAPEFDLAIDDAAGVHASDYAGVDFIL